MRAADFAARHFRWNFCALVIDSAAFWAGLAFFDGTTILPVLLARLHAPDAIVGLSRMIQTLGFTLPALFAAHYIHGRRSHKPFLLWSCGIGRLGLLTIPPVLYLFAADHPQAVMAWFFVVYAAFWLLDGSSAVSWLDIIGKTIPARVRGRFFGSMQTIAGAAAIAAGFLVRWVLGTQRFPLNFAILAACWCGGVGISQICLMLIREPDGEAHGEEKQPFWLYLKQALPMLRANRQLRTLLLTRVFLDGGGLAAPFYVLFARRDLHVGVAMVGVYTVVQAIGRLGAGPVWGWLADRAGPSSGIRAIAGGIAATPLLAIFAGHGAAWAFAGVFLLIGATQDALWMAGSTALMASVSERERPLAVAMGSVFQTPGALYGVLGGLLAQATSYSVVFSAASAMSAFGLIGALFLRDSMRNSKVTESSEC